MRVNDILILSILIFVIVIFINWSWVGEEVAHQTIAREASSEPLEAQIMVARVIRVRAEERYLTFKEVCLQPRQFSCWNKGVEQKPRTVMELAMAEEAWILSENRNDKINLYHDISVIPYWTEHPNVKFIKQIGKLKFYYEEYGDAIIGNSASL